jgi:hypothetical protein
MRMTTLGFIAVIICGVLLMPMLVDTAAPSAPTGGPVTQQLLVAELVRSR